MSRSPVLPVLALAMVSLSCSVFVGGPDLPASLPTSSGDPLQEMQSQVMQAMADGLRTGTVKLQFSEQQLAAYVAQELSAQDPPLLTEPRVVLGDQQLTLFGRARSGFIEANLSVTTEFSVDADGLPSIQVIDAQMGPLTVPESLQHAIASALDEALTGSIGPAALGFRLESIDISSGVMTINGRVR